jgi:nitric oxide reductase subunit B
MMSQSDYRYIFTLKRLWVIFAISLIVSFSVLLFVGGRVFQQTPPIPARVASQAGEVLFTDKDIQRGMDVWRRLGGMQLGSVWGHGSYLAPDWTADILHREAVGLLDRRAGGSYEKADEATKAALKALLQIDMKKNNYDPSSGTLRISSERAEIIKDLRLYYHGLFSDQQGSFSQLREAYAIPESPLGHQRDPRLVVEDTAALTAFFWWTSWAAVTHRPDDNVSYTSNWPHEPLVGNTPTAEAFIWTFVSIITLIAAIGGLTWFFNRERDIWKIEQAPPAGFPDDNPLTDIHHTPSMRAIGKYIWLAVTLLGVQILLGAVTAHYAVEGQEFYGLPLADYLPYALTRTWHTQLAISWIAVSWLAAGLYAAPLIGGFEARGQKHLVDILWLALVVVTLGSMAGEWAAIQGYITDPQTNFLFGHQGYEYLDLGRFWQILLFAGLLFWLVLMARNLVPAMRDKTRDDRHLVVLLFLATAAVGLLFGAGLLYDRTSHLTFAEYWRWWVVHLWVEGVFEVFATAWIAWVFTHMRLLNPKTAAIYVIFSSMIFLGGGVLGTFHHLYFTGTPQSVMALGAVFSALEVVPLALIAFEAHDHWKVERDAPWMKTYHVPLMFFLAVAFWNLIGAGVLGFLINPPLALYYMQGLMTTPTHGHAALFGVYGLLGIGLMLFCLRGLVGETPGWSDIVLKRVFWLFNVGLALMVFFSLLPQGLMQAYISFRDGYWHARTAEFLHSPWIEWFVWLRVPGDIVFALGALLLFWFVIRLLVWPRRD